MSRSPETRTPDAVDARPDDAVVLARSVLVPDQFAVIYDSYFACAGQRGEYRRQLRSV